MVNLIKNFKRQNFGKLIHLEKEKHLISGKWVLRELVFDEQSWFLPWHPTEEMWVYLKHTVDTVPPPFSLL